MFPLRGRFGPFMGEGHLVPVRVRQVYGPDSAGGAVMNETDEQDAGKAIQLLELNDLIEFDRASTGGPLDRPATPVTPGQREMAQDFRSNLPAALQWARRDAGIGPVGAGRSVASRVRGNESQAVFCSHPTYKPVAANLCLERISQVWRDVYLAGGPAPYCSTENPMTCGEAPWKYMPAAGKRFMKTGSIPRPAVEGVDFQVLSFQVPNSWDGVIVTITNQWDGGGFVDGSGDLAWRLMYDNQWFKDLDDIRIVLGRLENPYELEGAGYRLLTNQTVRYFVRLGVGALGRLDPNGRITCACSGWFYPRG